MADFHEVQFPPDIAYGAVGGPEYRTTVVVTASGREQRNSAWAQARGRWNVASGLKKREQVAALIAFFRARKGKAHGFRFKDWTDYQATGQALGTGDGATASFQLVKRYPSGSEVESRTITKPVAGTVEVYRDGVQATSGWSVNPTTGLVTFATAPAAGVVLAADCEFDLPARFDTDRMELALETYGLASWSTIPILELRP